VATFDHDYTSPGPPPAGSFTTTGAYPGAGDQAACVSWLTNLKTSKGKPIYLRKYHHRPYIDPIAPDDLVAAYKTALTTYGDAFLGAALFGGLTNPEKTATAESLKVLPYVTTRTLKKRGKRKKVA
jgi:hypothetical protein